MEKRPFLVVCLIIVIGFYATTVRADSGIETVKSSRNVPQTMNKLVEILTNKGMKIFARIDHAAGADSVGQSLRPTQLLIFGNPKVGAPLMQCQQTVALDLPQKMLAWEDAQGDVWLSYNQVSYISGRHAISGCEAVRAKVEKALQAFAQYATKSN